VVAADVDGDGDLDAVSAWEGSGRVRLHVQVDGLWSNLTIADGAYAAGAEDVAVGDVDGNGRMDVVAACESGRLIWIRQGTTWTPEVIDASANVGCSSWIDVELGDLAEDERPELVAACKAAGWVSVFHAADTPVSGASFQRFDIDTAHRRGASCVRLVDLDGDGDEDVISAARGETSDSIVWHENPGRRDAFVSAWARHTIGHWPDTIWLDVGDIDGDGRVDLAASSWENAGYAWFRQPSRVQDRWPRFTVGALEDTKGAGISITDLDEDGSVELVVGTYRDGRLAVFRPLTSVTGAWWPTTLAAPGGRLDLVPVADLDADGRLDILTTVDVEGGGVFWYRRWP
jgi:hypothetical protein